VADSDPVAKAQNLHADTTRALPTVSLSYLPAGEVNLASILPGNETPLSLQTNDFLLFIPRATATDVALYAGPIHSERGTNSVGSLQFGIPYKVISRSDEAEELEISAPHANPTNSCWLRNWKSAASYVTLPLPAKGLSIPGWHFLKLSKDAQPNPFSLSALSANASSGTLTLAHGGTNPVISVNPTSAMSGLSFPSSAGSIIYPMVTNKGGFIYSTADCSSTGQGGVDTGGRATYFFTITNSGQYTVTANVYAPNVASQSFWLNIDAPPEDPTMIWDVFPYTTNGFELKTVSWRGTGGFTNDQFNPQIFNLTSGSHRLIIVGRDANVELGQITISPYSAARPTAPQPPTDLHVVSGQ
jgi:hypothetical protein